MAEVFTIPRADLVRIVADAAASWPADCMPGMRDKVVTVALTTPAVAFGAYEYDGVGCPLTQAGLDRWRSKRGSSTISFYGAYDRAMRWRYPGHMRDPHVVVVDG